MPVLQYRCTKCGKEFEELVKSFKDKVVCPDCAACAERLWSGEMFSATGKQIKKCSGNCKNCNGCNH